MSTSRKSLTSATVSAYLEKCPQGLAARILDLGVDTVRDRLKTGAWRTAGRAAVNVFEAARLEKRRLRSGPVSIEAQRLKKAQAERAELENARTRGDLIGYNEAAEIAANVAGHAAQYFDNLGNRIAPAAAELDDPAAIVELVAAEAEQLRADLAVELERLAALGPHGADPPTPPAPRARRVGKPQPATRKRKRRKRSVSR